MRLERLGYPRQVVTRRAYLPARRRSWTKQIRDVVRPGGRGYLRAETEAGPARVLPSGVLKVVVPEVLGPGVRSAV